MPMGKNFGSAMRVLYLVDGGGGGALTQILELAGGLQDNILPEILFFSGGPAIEEAKKRGISIQQLTKKKSRLIFLYNLTRFLKEHRYDILHTHTLDGNLYGRTAGKLAQIPVLLTTVHSHIIDELKGAQKPNVRDRLRYRIDLFMSRWCKALVAVTDSIRDRLIEEGIAAQKIRVIENTVDIDKFHAKAEFYSGIREEFQIPKGAVLVGIVGRLVPLKNHDIFLRAAQIVVNRGRDVYFIIVGDGPLREQTEKYARLLGLDRRTIFTGWRSDINRIIYAMDTVVVCSRVEGLNVVLLEAMACRKPVIGTDTLGVNVLIQNGRNGLLIPLGDHLSLAEAILHILDNPGEAEAMGEEGRKLVEDRYPVQKMVQAYRQLYVELTA
jgi:glycosyltransferase involved in cell wall biosynthesis